MLNQKTLQEMTCCQEDGRRIVYPELNVAITSQRLKNGQIRNRVEVLSPPSRVLKVTRKGKRLTRQAKMP